MGSRKGSAKPIGRPSVFTPELLEQILTRIADGENERAIFRTEGFPAWQSWTAFKRRMAADTSDEGKAFHAQYAHSRDDKYETWEDHIIVKAKDDSRDTIEDTVEVLGKDGGVKAVKTIRKSDNTAVNRDRLVIDSMKWLMAKAMPKKYGDKIEQQHTGPDGGPIRFARAVDRPPKENHEQWKARVEAQLKALQKKPA